MTTPDPTTTEGAPDGQRRCPICRTSFTPSYRNSTRHTYCCERCRGAAWRHRHRRRSPDAVTASPTTNDDVHDVHPANDVHPARNGDVNGDPNGVNAVQLCPHCRQPIALITLVVTPTAAHVTVPELPTSHRGPAARSGDLRA